MLNRALLPVMLLCMLLPAATFAQAGYKSEEELIKSAEKFFDDKNYEKAFPLFSQIVSNRPDNSHYNYCLGVCIMKAGTDKAEAIRFLDLATKSPQNPADAWLYLGNAYHFSYRYDEAIAAYESYKSAAGKSSWNNAKGDLLIKMCRNGIQVKNDLSLNRHRILEKSEIEWADFYTLYRNLGDWGRFLKLPKEYEDKNTKEKPESAYLFLSTKGNVMMYSNAGKSSDKGFDIFKVIKDQKGMWMFPEALAEIINTSGDEAFPVIINEGKTIFFSSKGERSTGGYDVFRSDFDATTGRWSEPVSMGPPVNSPADDYYYVPSADNSIAYFASNRESQGTKCHVYKASINKEDKNFVTINGLFNCAAGLELSDARVTVLDPATSAIVAEFRTASQQGTYFLKLPAGSTYVYRVELVGFNTQEDVMDLSTNTAPELMQEILLVRNDQGKENMTITNRIPEKSQTVAANKPGQLLQVGSNDQLSPAATLSTSDRMVAMNSNTNKNSLEGKQNSENGGSGNVAVSNEANDTKSSNTNAPKGVNNSDETKSLNTTSGNSSDSKNGATTPSSSGNSAETKNGASTPSSSVSKSDKIQYGNNAVNNQDRQEDQSVAINTTTTSKDEKAADENQTKNGVADDSMKSSSQNESGKESTSENNSGADQKGTANAASSSSNDVSTRSVDQGKNQSDVNPDASATKSPQVAAQGKGNVDNDSSKSMAASDSDKTESATPTNAGNPAASGNGSSETIKGSEVNSPVAMNTSATSNTKAEAGADTQKTQSPDAKNTGNGSTTAETTKSGTSNSGKSTTTNVNSPDEIAGKNNDDPALTAAKPALENGQNEDAVTGTSKTTAEKVQQSSRQESTTSTPVAEKSTTTTQKESSQAALAKNESQKPISGSSPSASTEAAKSTLNSENSSTVAVSKAGNDSGAGAQQNKDAATNQNSESRPVSVVPSANQQSAETKKESAQSSDSTAPIALNNQNDQKSGSDNSSNALASSSQKTDNKSVNSNTSVDGSGNSASVGIPASAGKDESVGGNTAKAVKEETGSKEKSTLLTTDQPVASTQGKSSGDGKANTASDGSSEQSASNNKQQAQPVEHNGGETQANAVSAEKAATEPAAEGTVAENGKKSRKGGLFGRRNKENNNEPVIAEAVQAETTPATPEVEEELYKNLVFRVQLGAYKDRSVDELRQKYTAMGLTDLVYVKNESGLLLVMTGSENSYTSAIALKEAMIAKGVPDAFIVVYSEGARLPVQMVVRVDE